MKIYYTKEFIDRLNSRNSEIDLGYFSLGTQLPSYDNLDKVTLDYLRKDSGRSPSVGYYEYTGILDKESNRLLLNLCVPSYDFGIIRDSYKCCYCLFKELDKLNLGFLLLAEEGDKLSLDNTQNIIEIPNFSTLGKINLKVPEDIEFLESTVGDISNIYSNLEDNIVSIESWNSWRLEKLGTDTYPHVNTVFINKFGIKTY